MYLNMKSRSILNSVLQDLFFFHYYNDNINRALNYSTELCYSTVFLPFVLSLFPRTLRRRKKYTELLQYIF